MTDAVLAVPVTGDRTEDNKWMVAISISFGAIMATVDLSIVNVALPQIRGSIGASIDQMAALATSFAIAQVIVMPLTAFLGRFFGQKRVYLFCLGLFLVGSAVCGMARTLTQLVLARALQGFGGGALQPTQQAILRQTFPLREQGMAMAVFAMAVMIGPALGPSLGGWIVDNWSWPWIFYINLPVGVLAIVMVSRFVHEPEDIRAANKAAAARMRGNLDWAGIAFMSIGLASMQYVLEEGTRNDWFDSTTITLMTLVAVFSLTAFFIQEFRTPHPAVNLRLFRNGIFSSATFVGGIMYAILLGNMFLLPVFTQELLGYTALQSGWALMPRSLVMMVATPIIGKLYNRVPPAVLIGLGVICVAWGSWEMGHFTLQTTPSGITAALILQGVGFALLFVPLTTVAMSHIARNDISEASGLNSLARQLGGSIGLAVFTTMLTRWSVQAGAAISNHIDITRPEVRTEMAELVALFQSRGMDAVHARSAALTMLQRQVAGQAAVIAFDKTFMLGAVLMVLLLPLVLMLRRADNEEGPSHAAAVEA